ncbi:MAG TPA: GAF domain-containing protein [Chitinophagaceae bacterium]|jgi:GAF domain-containing protein|nr:GAF domain-containing protein [Chitinophagaceae bacterium]
MENTFGKPIIPDDDEKRVQALNSYNILHTLPEGFFNNLANIVAQCFDTPIALISLVDKEEVFFKANVGMSGTDYVKRGVSLCSLAILDTEPTIFEDTLKEPCLLANPLVAGEFGLRFYAGAPITTPDGYNIGTICVVDKQPRTFTELDQDLLRRFAVSVMEAIINRKQNMQQPQHL